MAPKQVIYVCNSDYSRILYASDGFCRKFNVERNNPYNVLIARGISFYIDENGNKKSVDQWFRDADEKMYKDKKESR